MKRCHLMLLILACSFFTLPAKACLWDYDTLQMEATGKPKLVHAIIGHFPRNPPLFFEMRLERNAKLIAENPDDPTLLEAYDNCAVACDRLGRMDEAIEWMKKKKAVLDQLDPNDPLYKEHQYRYLANLGTHHIHRWLKRGKPREDLSDVNRSIELLTAAIELNPDAHFGREKYQLRIIKQIHEAQAQGQNYSYIDVGEILGETDDSNFQEANQQWIEAIVGIITMGAGWESALMYHALSESLGYTRDHILAGFAFLRASEIDLQNGIQHRGFDGAEFGVRDDRWKKMQAEYASYRTQVNQYQEERLTFMMSKLQAGEHPDTHPDFFSGEGERFAPSSFASEDVMRSYVGYPPLINWSDPMTNIAIAGIVVLLIILFILGLIILFIVSGIQRKRNRKLMQIAESTQAHTPPQL